MYCRFLLKRLREGGGFTQARFNKLTSYRYLKLHGLYFVLVTFNALSPLEEFAGVRSYLTSARSFHLSEEIAFYQGEKREKQTIESTFQRLVRLRIEKKSNTPFLRFTK